MNGYSRTGCLPVAVTLVGFGVGFFGAVLGALAQGFSGEDTDAWYWASLWGWVVFWAVVLPVVVWVWHDRKLGRSAARIAQRLVGAFAVAGSIFLLPPLFTAVFSGDSESNRLSFLLLTVAVPVAVLWSIYVALRKRSNSSAFASRGGLALVPPEGLDARSWRDARLEAEFRIEGGTEVLVVERWRVWAKVATKDREGKYWVDGRRLGEPSNEGE